MKLKNIEWEKIDESVYFGYVGGYNGYRLFKIVFEYGTYFIHSKMTAKYFLDNYNYINVCFVDIDEAKEYCQNVYLKELVGIFISEIDE